MLTYELPYQCNVKVRIKDTYNYTQFVYNGMDWAYWKFYNSKVWQLLLSSSTKRKEKDGIYFLKEQE